jgi:hypothetical protein
MGRPRNDLRVRGRWRTEGDPGPGTGTESGRSWKWTHQTTTAHLEQEIKNENAAKAGEKCIFYSVKWEMLGLAKKEILSICSLFEYDIR